VTFAASTDLVPSYAANEEGWASATWRVLRQSVLFVVAMGLAGGGVAGLLTRLQPATYMTGRTFVVQTSSGRGDSETLIRTVESLMLSKQIGDDIVRAVGDDLSARAVIRKLSVSRPPSSGVLTVTVRDTDPKRSLAIASSLGSVFEKRLRSLLTARPGSLAPGFSVESWGTPSQVSEVPPPVSRNVGVGFLLGVAIATVGMVLRHQRYPVLRSPSHAVEAFDLPLIAALPTLSEGGRGSWNSLDAVEALLLRSPYTSGTGGTSGADVLFVTGPAAGDARAELVMTLARVLAGTDARVVLIDADLDGAALTRRFDATRRPGLRETLDDQRSPQLVGVDLGTSRIQPDGPAPKVALLPVGQAGSTQLTTAAARRLIEAIDPDTVVIVHGPRLPGPAPVAGLAKQASIIVVAGMENVTMQRDARAAGSLVKTLTAGNAGVVLLGSADPRVGAGGAMAQPTWRSRRTATV
jgi:capsular polysaccharide biosynthesis protein